MNPAASATLPLSRRALLLIVGSALLLRVGWIAVRWHQLGSSFEFDDERLHWQLAGNLVTRGEMVSDDGRYAARMPLYPLFLAGFAAIGELGVLAARLAQAMLGALTAGLVALLAGRMFGRWAGLAAGIMAACDPYAVFFANLLLTEVPFTLVFVACIAAAAAGAGPAARGLVAVLGPCAVLIRPSALGAVGLVWLWQLCVRQQGIGPRCIRQPYRRQVGHARSDAPATPAAPATPSAQADQSCAVRLPAALAVLLLNLLVFALLLLPWGLRNQQVLGAPAWLSTNGGVTLYDAQGPQADGRGDQSFLLEMPELAALGEVERDRRLRDLAIEQMRHDPWRVLTLAWTKFLRTWNPIPNLADYRGGATGVVSAIYTLGVLLLAAAGLWYGRRQRAGLILLLVPVLYFTLVHCVYIGSLRYRIPLMPFLVILAAGGLAGLLRRDRQAAGEYHTGEPASH